MALPSPGVRIRGANRMGTGYNLPMPRERDQVDLPGYEAHVARQRAIQRKRMRITAMLAGIVAFAAIPAWACDTRQ